MSKPSVNLCGTVSKKETETYGDNDQYIRETVEIKVYVSGGINGTLTLKGYGDGRVPLEVGRRVNLYILEVGGD
jgi:hypothetical protein